MLFQTCTTSCSFAECQKDILKNVLNQTFLKIYFWSYTEERIKFLNDRSVSDTIFLFGWTLCLVCSDNSFSHTRMHHKYTVLRQWIYLQSIKSMKKPPNTTSFQSLRTASNTRGNSNCRAVWITAKRQSSGENTADAFFVKPGLLALLSICCLIEHKY